MKFIIKKSENFSTIFLYENNNEVGYCKIRYLNDVFKNWNRNSFDLITDKIDTKVKTLYILSIKAKKGYGNKLVSFLEKHAIDNNIEYIALASIMETIGFWKKMNFKIYSSDFLINMYKEL